MKYKKLVPRARFEPASTEPQSAILAAILSGQLMFILLVGF